MQDGPFNYHQYPQEPPQQQPLFGDETPPPQKKKNPVLIVLIVAAVVAVLVCIAAVLSQRSDKGTLTSKPVASKAVEIAKGAHTNPPAAGKQNPQPAPTKTKAKPAPTIHAGEYEVPGDVAPGKYKTAGATAGLVPLCSYTITKDGDYVDAGVVTGKAEQAYATLKAGQTFQTSGCQPWVKQGG